MPSTGPWPGRRRRNRSSCCATRRSTASPLLPLDLAPGASIALIGGLASAVNLGDGGSSDVWAPEVVTVVEGLRSALPDVIVTYDDGTDLTTAAGLAGSADVALVVVGYTRADEGEYIGEFATAHLAHLFPGDDDPDLVKRFTAQISTERLIEPPAHAAASAADGGFATGGDRSSLRLHDRDVALIRAVAAANPRTVVAIVAGSAVVISEWDAAVPAIVQSWYAGMEGGDGLADVLTGAVDASGRLPFSVPVARVGPPCLRRRRRGVPTTTGGTGTGTSPDGTSPPPTRSDSASATPRSCSGRAEAERAGTRIRVLASLENTGDDRVPMSSRSMPVRRSGPTGRSVWLASPGWSWRPGTSSEVSVEIELGTLVRTGPRVALDGGAPRNL